MAIDKFPHQTEPARRDRGLGADQGQYGAEQSQRTTSPNKSKRGAKDVPTGDLRPPEVEPRPSLTQGDKKNLGLSKD